MDDDEKKGGGGLAAETVEIIILVVLIVAIIIVWVFSSRLSDAWNFLVNLSSLSSPTLAVAKTTIGIWQGLAIPLSLFFLIGIMYSIVRVREIRHKEKQIFNAHTQAAYESASDAAANGGDPALTMRWRTILDLSESTNANDWKQAIMDADIILDQILFQAGFIGDSLGERLRNATKGDFKTLEQAGEAHGVRNDIAHGNVGFVLTQHEAKRVIGLYKQVFEEFYFI